MSDQDFNFRPPQRREAKTFEPPPWERDAFDDLARKKAEEDAATEAAEAAALTAEAAEPPAAGPQLDVPPLVAPAEESRAEVPAPVQPEPAESGQQGQQGAERTKLDEARVIEMLADLRSEEPQVKGTFEKIGLFGAFATGLIGIVLLFWAMAAFVAGSRHPGPVAFFGGSVLALFGAMFIGLAFWVAARTLRQRGVI